MSEYAKPMAKGGEVECPSCGHGFCVQAMPDVPPEENAGQEAAEEAMDAPSGGSFADAIRKRKAKR